MPQITVVLSERATGDIVRIKYFLDAIDADLSEIVIKKIITGFRRLITFPESGREVYNKQGIREIFIPHGSAGYTARYIYEEGRVVILAIRHQKELPVFQ